MRWPDRTAEERYWEKVDRRGPDECWPWTAGTGKGYGRLMLRVEGRWKQVQAHRFGWGLAHGTPPPPNLVVCHTCDNRPCQNPRHWFLGTTADNLEDMRDKGRDSPPPRHDQRGEKGPGAKLTPDQVIEIRRRYATGELQRVIAADYGIDQVNVSCIVTGKSWAHLPFS